MLKLSNGVTSLKYTQNMLNIDWFYEETERRTLFEERINRNSKRSWLYKIKVLMMN